MKTISKYLKALAVIFFIGVTSVFSQSDNSKQVLSEFNTIIVSSSMAVTLTQGTENSISIKGGNIQDLKFEISDKVLYLKGKAGEDVTVNFVNLNKIKAFSSCEIKSSNQINSDKLEIIIRGSSDLNLDINVKELYTTIEGSGDVKYKGTAVSHTIDIKGSGDLNAFGLTTTSTNAQISGSGDAQVNTSQDLKGVINGSGEIAYSKEPFNRNITVNGSGTYGLKDAEIEAVVNAKKKDYDSIKFNFGDYNVYVIKSDIGVNGKEKPKRDTTNDNNKFRTYWAGFGLGINGYLNSNNKTKVPSGFDLDYCKSINVALNFWEKKIPIWKRHINIVTGMGFDFSNYRFSNNYKLQKDSTHVSAVYDSTVKFNKNKLMVAYLNIPLLLQFDTDPIGKRNRTIHLSAGLVGSLRIGSHTKQEYEIGGTTYKPKIHDNFDLNAFNYSAMVRIGYGKIDLYASYALNSLFKQNEGPLLYPFTVGINLLSF